MIEQVGNEVQFGVKTKINLYEGNIFCLWVVVSVRYYVA